MALGVTAQTNPDDWSTYSIPDVCSFKVPPTMEVRLEDSFQGRFVKSMHQSSFFEMLCNECDLFYEEAKLVLQPKGLNSDPFSDEFREAHNNYGRIIFRFSYNDILSQEDIADLAPSELTLLDSMWRKEVKESLDCIGKYSGFKGSFAWYPLRKENYNGLSALVTEYDRPGASVETHVREYKFFYKGKYLLITTSYNQKHEAKYKDDFMTFMQLLKIETNFESAKAKQSNKGLFMSEEYHVSFVYDPIKYSEAKKQNKSSHCFFKLVSEDGSSVLLSAWDLEDSTEGFSIHEKEVVDEMKERDKNTLSNIVKSCEKARIGHVEALKSVAINNVLGINHIYTTYRVFYKDRFYIVDFHIPETVYNKDEHIVDELIKGLQFN